MFQCSWDSFKKSEMDHAGYNWYQFSLSLTCSLSSTAERVESATSDLKKEFGEQHVWVPTSELLDSYIVIEATSKYYSATHAIS